MIISSTEAQMISLQIVSNDSNRSKCWNGLDQMCIWKKIQRLVIPDDPFDELLMLGTWTGS